MRLAAFVVGVVLSLSLPLPGQTLGEITGEVRDPSGSIIAGSDVKVVSKATSAERTTVTNGVGLYSFPALQPGVYDVMAGKTGFQSVTRTDLELQVQQTARVDFALPIGQATQVVEVTAGAPLLTTENATVGAVIENRRIVELPLNGRNFLQLVSLTPNVSSGFADAGTGGGAAQRLGGQRSQQNISVAGQRSEFNHFTLDGIENTDPTYNTYVFLPSIDALQEFKVQTGIYPAEFGRALGQINVSTKSGTNAFHGSMFEFLRNDKLDAKDYAFDTNRPPKNPFKWNQYGFTLGGPVWIPKVFNGRNRLFFFSNFEGYRDRKSLPGFYNVPYAAMRTGDFTGFPAIYDPTTRVQNGTQITALPFQGNKIPTNRINAKAAQLLEFLPPPNASTGSFTSDLQEGDRRVIDKDQFSQRIDFIESSKSNWYGRYSRSSEFQTQALIGGTGTKVTSEPRQEMISNSRVFSPTMVNEFRVSHTGFANDLATPLAGIRDVLSEVKIPGFVTPLPSEWGSPQIQINPFSIFGDNTNGPFVNNDHIFQAVDNFSWTKGRHSLRFGVEFRGDRFNIIGNSSPRGSFIVTGIATENPALPLGYSSGSGTSFADFLLGYVQQSTIPVGVGFGQFRSTSQNYYIDDTWRIHPKVTLSIGLRYENVPPYYDKSQKFANIDWPMKLPSGVVNPADRSLHPTLVRIGQGDFYQDLGLRFNPAINVARDGRLGDSGIFRDNNNFAPRLGIAWSPTDKWTMRAGIGVFFVQDIADIYLDASRNLAGTRVSQANTSFPNLTLDNPFGAVDPNALLTVSTPKILGIDPHERTPYNIQFLFNLQRQFGKDTVIEAGYLGAESHKLWSWQPINEPRPSAVGSAASRAPFPEISVSSWIMSGTGNSNYHSLSAKLQHRVGQGLTLMGSYTWSKSIDLSSGARAHGGEQQFPQTTWCLQCERGLSNFNVAQRFVTSTLYELPFGKGKSLLKRGGVANAIAGGWQVSSILTLQTGMPATIINGYDAPNYGQTISRPNATGATVALPSGQQDPNLFFNTAAFVRASLGTFGNVGRNTLIGPGLFNWDFSAIKNFQVRENQQVQFRLEVFNLPNHPNWALPSTTLTDPNFGKIRATRTDMRDIQLGLKYVF